MILTDGDLHDRQAVELGLGHRAKRGEDDLLTLRDALVDDVGQRVGDRAGLAHGHVVHAGPRRGGDRDAVGLANADHKQAAWVAVTFGPGTPGKELTRLLRLFPSTVEVPPLRHHEEDIQQLAPFLLARLGYGGQLTCSPEVLQMLMRSNWPDNIEQRFQTLR